MKIEKLIIQNLNSIECAEIDFVNGVLAKEPLFLICGDMGSGKTTILDAITLALYDKAARYECVGNDAKIEDGKNSTGNTNNILREGTMEGKAELYFTVRNVTYVATWSVGKTRNGTYKSSKDRRKLEVIDGDKRTVLSTNVGEVNSKIVDFVGLSYDQFIRSVMLAQGEFSTFLKSKKEDQSAILEMLTGTEVYSKIAKAVGDKSAQAKNERDNAKKDRDESNDKFLLSEGEVAKLESKDQLSESISQKENEAKKIEKAIGWFNRNDELKDSCTKARQLYDSAMERVNSQEYKENKSVVEDYRRTVKEREVLENLRRIESELESAEVNYNEDVRKYLNLKVSLQGEKNNRDELVVRFEELKRWIENNKDKELLSNDINLVLKLLTDLDDGLKQMKDKEKELKDGVLNLEFVSSQCQSFLSDFESVKKLKNEAEVNLEKLLNQFNSKEYEDLMSKKQGLEDERRVHIDRSAKLTNIRTVLKQYLDLNESIENYKVKYNNLNLSFNQKNNELLTAKTAFETKNSEFQMQKEMVEEWAKEYRSKLKDGEPCPVCGSKDHYYKDESVVQSLFATIENEWNKSRDSYEKSKDELNKIGADRDALLDNINNEKKRLDSLLKDLNNRCDGKPVFKIEIIDYHIKRCDDLISGIDNQIRETNEKLNGIAIIKKDIDDAQKNKKRIDDKYNSVEKSLSTKQSEYQQIELSLNHIKKLIQDQKTKLQENEGRLNEFIKIENWKQSFLNSPTDFVNSIKNDDLEWKSKNKSLKDTENQISNLSEIIKQCENYVSLVYDLISDVELDFTRHRVETCDLVLSFYAVYERIKDRLTEKNRKNEIKNDIEHKINCFIKDTGISRERLKFISEINDIQVFENKNKSWDDELIKAKNTLTIKTEEFNSHQDSEFKPNDITSLGELEVTLNSLMKEKKSEEESLVDIKIKLAQHAQNASELLIRQKEFDKKASEYKLWEQLAKAIGTTPKDNFRDVAQAYTMGILLDRANYYMEQLSNKYKLASYPDSLAIMVRDMEMGGELRAASSLSGGETFLVSLALALGLTSLNDKHFDIDVLFIDEGFGTLDSGTLDMVMNTLENLRNLGKKVGIISHIDTLKERIPAKIQLVRDGKSASRVEIVRN